jgi:hypothetical protein
VIPDGTRTNRAETFASPAGYISPGESLPGRIISPALDQLYFATEQLSDETDAERHVGPGGTRSL